VVTWAVEGWTVTSVDVRSASHLSSDGGRLVTVDLARAGGGEPVNSSARHEDRGDVPIWPILAMLPLLLCMVAMVAISNGGASLSQLVVWSFGGLGFMTDVFAVGCGDGDR
jgi:hypothetical protein